jgi:uncharacterized protein YbcI
MSEVQPGARINASVAISNGAVRILREYTGRGPTKARTVIGRDTVLILFADTLTKGEQKLAEVGDAEAVLEMRHRFQLAMSEELTSMVEAHVEREVVAFMSANHLDPDLAAEVFVLKPLEQARDGETPGPDGADAHGVRLEDEPVAD